MDQAEDRKENNPHFWLANAKLLLSARIFLLSVALFSASLCFFFLEFKTIPERYIFLPIAFLFGLSGISAIWLRRRQARPPFIILHYLIDILAVTGAVYLTGGISSPLVFLYLPLVMAASLMLDRRSALVLIACGSLSYTGLAISIASGWLAPADGGPIPSAPTGGIYLHVTGLTSAMILLSFLSSFLNRLAFASYADAAQSKKDLAALSSSQRELEEKLAMQERMARLLAEKREPPQPAPEILSRIVGESAIMQKVFNLIQRVSATDATVLISGESGTGKELVARAIHAGKNRGKTPFIAVNCGAIPENLIESQLFGYKRGSFTGAESDHSGLFLQADGGTIFLDEIGELPLLMQTKLLRVIQEKNLRPIGGMKDIPVEVRIIAATNKNLKKEVELGRFREDLFYRLNVINIRIPPLRTRKEDIPLLVKSILQKLLPGDRAGVIAPGAMEKLMVYDYPGNVRELENILERAIVLGGEVILPEHLPSHIEIPRLNPERAETEIIVNENIELPVDLEDILNNIERKYLEAALIHTSGAKKKAAQILGINFRSFRYRLQKFGIETEDK